MGKPQSKSAPPAPAAQVTTNSQPTVTGSGVARSVGVPLQPTVIISTPPLGAPAANANVGSAVGPTPSSVTAAQLSFTIKNFPKAVPSTLSPNFKANTQEVLPYFFTYDQGDTLANTAAACLTAITILYSNLHKNFVKFSVPFLYYASRFIQDDQDSILKDEGSSAIECCRILKSIGCCLEQSFTLDNPINKQPPQSCFAEANLYRIKDFINIDIYADVCSINNPVDVIKRYIDLEYPVIATILISENFFSEETGKIGVIQTPDPNKDALDYQLTLTIIGYNETQRAFIFANTFGSNWGNLGGGWFLEDYITPDLITELFVITI